MLGNPHPWATAHLAVHHAIPRDAADASVGREAAGDALAHLALRVNELAVCIAKRKWPALQHMDGSERTAGECRCRPIVSGRHICSTHSKRAEGDLHCQM